MKVKENTLNNSLQLILRNESEKFIITLHDNYSRVHLCYLDKQEVLEEHNINLDLVAKKFNGEPLKVLTHLKYNEVIR